ncbi:ANTAR domain-containing protein [Sediminihabitans luteus]|uniref:ANTAR domain-containing protein n=1 Tax=Sediminihabitans luteus TaxID=1138585 RepID=A0A2M9CCW1_9CELL|nr:ANTAR domain-containing protein [Sediminihabitans luteus]PJJ69225.1 ANTAR domain-containing protein [Sediminihabitans luteus]GII98901.1 GAF domain-containing protein [Sediminihabitans luteus]
MGETTELVSRLERGLARQVAGEDSFDRACRVCVDVLAADGGSIAFGPSANAAVRTSTDLTAALLAEVQERVGEGPVHDAYALAQPAEAVLADVAAEGTALDGTVPDGTGLDGALEPAARRWPTFWPVARAAVGDVRLFTFPLHVGGWTYGVLSLWTRRTRLADAVGEVQSAVDEVGVTLLRRSRATSDHTGGRDWQERARVHQATGMVVAQLGVPITDAVAVLRARAFTEGVAVADVAADVVARRTVFGSPGV